MGDSGGAPPKVEFTDLDLTAYGGASVLAQTAGRFGLFELLDETLWALIALLAHDHVALRDLDALRTDTVASTLLSLGNVPEARLSMAT